MLEYLDDRLMPKVFKTAEEPAVEEKIITKPKTIPMPFIDGRTDTNKGPVVITEDWYVKCRKKELAEIAKDRKAAQIEMMQLIAERDRLRYKLGKLDMSKKRDSKIAVAMNVKIKDINAELESLQSITGININTLDKGSRLGIFVGKCKRLFHKVKKAVKKWWERNGELITGLAAIILPFIANKLVKKLAEVFT